MKDLLETYKVMVVYTGHITKDDNDLLHSLTHRHPHALEHPLRNMIMDRDTGYFIKLYDELELNLCPEHSSSFNKLIKWAFNNGFRMIEIDCDGPAYDMFETFDW